MTFGGPVNGLLRREEVADRLHVSVTTVRRLGRSGALAEVRIGRRMIRIKAGSVDKLIEDGQHADRQNRDTAHA
jgi:excisionase family DNA binding protein